jgi:hypothetical protein
MEDKRELLKNKIMKEFSLQFFNYTGELTRMLELIDKKTLVDGMFMNSDAYLEIDDITAEHLLACESSLDEIYNLHNEYH